MGGEKGPDFDASGLPRTDGPYEEEEITEAEQAEQAEIDAAHALAEEIRRKRQ